MNVPTRVGLAAFYALAGQFKRLNIADLQPGSNVIPRMMEEIIHRDPFQKLMRNLVVGTICGEIHVYSKYSGAFFQVGSS